MSETEECVKCAHCQLSSTIFDPLTEEQKEMISEGSFEVAFKAGETIFKQGAPMTHVVCITSGMAKFYIEDGSSRNIIIKLLKGGELAGFTGITKQETHYYTLSTLSETQACFIKADLFKVLIRSNPDFAFRLIDQINKYHVNLYNKLRGFLNKNVSGRVASTLLYMANEIYNSDTFVTDLSRQDMADLSATTKESTIRVLKDLRDQDIVKCDDNFFEILQKNRLLKISHFG